VTLQKQKHHHNKPHVPVLLNEVLELLEPKSGESYLDLTAGYGGHAREVINKTKSPERAVLVDRDQEALETLQDLAEEGATLINSDFSSVVQEMQRGKRQFDLILIDLGVSSPQIDTAERGFSFNRDGPLDMRMNQESGLTAAELINNSSKDEILEILQRYGEEPHKKLIAQAIVTNRPFTRTLELSNVIENTIRRRGKTHPATRTFQAFRIAVNGELEQIENSLSFLPDLLSQNGRLAIISFHSLEDRIVKRFFQEESRSGYEAKLKLLNKKPILGATEAVHNQRSRSAMLRAGVKINTQ
jgi:16S rRNA (cytosine1402-N4)-methyltransferase